MHRLAKLTIPCLVLSACLVAQRTPLCYSAEEVNEFSQTLSDGTKIHTETHTKIYQDSKGRLRNDTGNFAIIYDPVADVAYQLDLEKQTANQLVFNISYEEAVAPNPNREKGVIFIVANPQGSGYRFRATINLSPLGPNRLASTTFTGSSFEMGPNGASSDPVQSMKEQAVMQLMNSVQRSGTMFREPPQTEQLGTQTFDGFVATGTRSTTTFTAGTIGNDQAFQTVNETWMSSDLGRPVLTKSTDPRYGDRTMQLINISKGDPDLSFFQPPPGFKLENAPRSAAPEPSPHTAPQTVATRLEHVQSSAAPQTVNAGADAAQILSVSPDARSELHDGQAVQFTVTLHYSLRSVDEAVLAVYAERYAPSAQPCNTKGLHHTEGATNVLLKRGEGDVTVQFPWREGIGPNSVPRGAAFIAIGLNLWPEENGRPGKPVIQKFGTSFCRPVNP